MLDGPAWNPGRLTTIRQRFLDELRTYQSSLIGGYPALTSEEPGTVVIRVVGGAFDMMGQTTTPKVCQLLFGANFTWCVRVNPESVRMQGIMSIGTMGGPIFFGAEGSNVFLYSDAA